jgi:hypothetical protein
LASFAEFLPLVVVIIDEQVEKKILKFLQLPEGMEQNERVMHASYLEVGKRYFVPGCNIIFDFVVGGSKK